MAAASSAQRLQDEASCSLCHKYFTEPVSIDCGHSFCQSCITQHWEELDSNFSCPRCGGISAPSSLFGLKRKFRPNKELGNFVEIAKQMKVEMAESVGGEKMCETHQEPLKLFCKDEQKPMCSTCAESKEHTTEAFVPAEEAAQEYKKKLESQLQAWSEKREKMVVFHTEEEDRYKNFLEKVDTEKQKIVSKFEEVEKFLKQQKSALLGQLEKLVKKEEKFIAKLSSDIYLSDILIREMKEKQQQPPSAFLQDIEKTLSRYEVCDFQLPDICSELEEKLHAFSKKYIILQETLRRFTESLSQQLDVKWVSVTLDPDTAHPQLSVSADQKTLTCTKAAGNVTDYPQRFSSSYCVLGCEGFTSGRHYWEVRTQEARFWAVGVARESLKRKEYMDLEKLQEGIWAVCKRESSSLTVGGLELKCDVPKTIGVHLDYGRNRVSFSDADVGNVLHTFHLASFKAEKIRPFFYLANQARSPKRVVIIPSQGLSLQKVAYVQSFPAASAMVIIR